MYTAIDDRKFFVVKDEASDFHHTMIALAIQPAEFIRVTRIKHGGRGGGFSLRVERVEDAPELVPQPEPQYVRQPQRQYPAPPSRTEALLEKSVEMARTQGPGSFRTEPRTVEETAQPISPAAVRLCSTMCVLIDALAEGRAFAQRRGIDLTNEDLRCLVTTAFIQDSRGAR